MTSITQVVWQPSLPLPLPQHFASVNMPGNVRVAKGEAGMTRESVANVTALVTLDKSELGRRTGRVRPHTLERVDEGLRTVLVCEYLLIQLHRTSMKS